jgi:hypothetical protein
VQLVVTDYLAPDGGSTVYENVLHSLTDRARDPEEIFTRAIRELGVEKGDEIEVVIRRTGRRPFGDRRVFVVNSHTFAREK